AFRHDDVDCRIYQRDGKFRQARDISVAPLRNQYEVTPLHPAMIGEPAHECLEFALGRWCGTEEPDAPHPFALLRACRERPRSRCASEQRDELAPFHLRGHSMTSSAHSRIEGGSVMPISLAVFRFATRWKCVGRSIGNSATFAPCRILRAMAPIWR